MKKDIRLLSREYRALRLVLGLSQDDAAKIHNKTLRTIQRWECGYSRVPSYSCIEILSLFLFFNETIRAAAGDASKISRLIENPPPTIKTLPPSFLAMLRARVCAQSFI